MQALSPLEPTRASMGRVILLSLLVPGLGHAQVGRKGEALFWFALCQGLLFLGFFLAEFTQFDFGRGFGAQGATWIFALLPEMANFGGTQVAAFFFQSAELGGLTPDAIPYRDWGHVLSGGSGLLAMVAAAHAASGTFIRMEPAPLPLVSPGKAVLGAFLFPGLGHWMTGRRFKAMFLGGMVLGLFLLGMLLGDFADFDRTRHPYYWAGQMSGGPFFWLVALLTQGCRFSEVLPFQDAGLLFTTSAGLFNGVLCLDAYRRAEEDWILEIRGPQKEVG